MTAEELIVSALALKGESADMAEEYRDFSLAALNILLAETLPLENQLRYAEGEPALAMAPLVRGLSDEIRYHETLARTCLVYGMAARLMAEDSDLAHFNYYNAMYTQSFYNTPGVFEPVRDAVWRDD